ncbi:hypothetical protein M5V91_14555 [Cytobacillus pseudoceanisediminis]|uniref:hypothetical protein n=1 Tax=Cytobacillus pseudoceanisediminis TaxID=3051614 RepID=UPI00218AC878|nr:hypothetical protein [Cytobacillus pseudoceanisediminis]UQX52288.1 hypothetical protein M5V91_14555 [Cytobacillus pseudoceanisediminis]
MQVNLQQLRSIMKESGIPVYRDDAPTTADYPYIIYEFVNETQKRSSSKVLKSMPLYQIALITNGTEIDYEPLKAAFNKHQVEYSSFEGFPYDENDNTITQFITNVRCVN